MQRHKLYWVALCFMTLALVAAAPPAAFCDDVTEIDTGKTPIGNVDGLHQGVAASRDYFWYGEGNSPELVAFYTNTLDNKLAADLVYNGNHKDLGLENSNAAISCPENPTQAIASISHMPEDPERSVAVVGEICQGAAEIAVIALPLS